MIDDCHSQTNQQESRHEQQKRMDSMGRPWCR